MSDYNFQQHLISSRSFIIDALKQLNTLAKDAILFVVDENNRLIGSLTDGDVRRGLLSGYSTENKVDDFVQFHPRYIRRGNYDIKNIIQLRADNFKVLPVLNKDDIVVNVINFRFLKSYLPLDAIIMAGGRGSRWSPLTDTTPKPLLKIGNKPIIEHNLDRLRKFGVDDFFISLRYLGEQIENYFGKGESRGVSIQYVWEDQPLGTIGAVSKIANFQHEYVLIINSDILTNLNYEDFFLDFIENDADMSVVTIPYTVVVPYAVMETTANLVDSFKEKPSYTYYSNGGIYLVKREILKNIPTNTHYNTTDLMQLLVDQNKKVITFPMRQYWLDIGKPEDFEKAQVDIKHIDL
jgi:dTDP-glucose pyrophosphorylase